VAATVDLQARYPRRFVPPQADPGDWAQMEPLFERLLRARPDSPEALERWLEDASELFAVLDEERTRRYVAMTSQTDDPERERAFLFFVEHITPRLKPLAHALDQAYLASPHRAALPSRYAVLGRAIENRVALFRPENVPLEVEETKLKQQFQRIAGAMTVTFRGREHTLPQMGPYLEEPDRALRQEAWELVVRRRMADRDRLDDLFDRLLDLRQRIARNAGCADYRAYAFRARERFDYTPEDCLRFHDAVERAVVPLAARLRERRKAMLGVDPLRPWDLAVDPAGRPRLRPFEQVERLLDGAQEIFDRLDPRLGAQFRFMRERGLLDLESRKGKAPGGYQSTMDERRVPFIFMNAVGVDGDVRTLLHEAGHAFHALAARDDPLLEYRHAPPEFSEVASMAMELLALPHLGVFYPIEDDARRAGAEHYERVVFLFTWVATIDAFQHWLYTHPGHGRDERRDAWVRILNRFTPVVDYRGYEDARDALWQQQLHLFVAPFYYVEYGIAEAGALQIWRRAQTDPAGALRDYRQALALGGSRPLPHLFAAAGARFDFSAQTLGPLMDALAEALGL
jgi:oligoendopeptidase F